MTGVQNVESVCEKTFDAKNEPDDLSAPKDRRTGNCVNE